jgi:hypothetical protein
MHFYENFLQYFSAYISLPNPIIIKIIEIIRNKNRGVERAGSIEQIQAASGNSRAYYNSSADMDLY